MASSLLRALRCALMVRTNRLQSTARRRFRLRVESLEGRLLMHGAPHGGAGTLSDEHEAVMHLVDFAEIHDTASNPTFYVARDGNGADPNFWSDARNWSLATFGDDPAPAADLIIFEPDDQNNPYPGFTLATAGRLPSTGDDVEIPEGLDFIYDLTPATFTNLATLPAKLSSATPPVVPSVKNNLRLHSIGVEGSLTFQPNPAIPAAPGKTELLMYFETLVVAPTGALTINDDDQTHSVRLVIGASDWSQFSLAQPFDTELDPFQFARGLISHGEVQMAGEDVTPYITLPQLTRKDNNIAPVKTAATSKAPAVVIDPGSFKFTVPAGVATAGWSVGDRIVVTGTDPSKVNSATGASSDEEAVITNIASNADGSTTFFAQVQVAVLQSNDLLAPPTAVKTVGGLQHDHVPPKDTNGQPYVGADGKAAFGVQIANLTRSINIQSENPYHTLARGHVMFMHNSDVQIDGVGFLGLGRSDKRTVVDDVQFYTKEIIVALNQAAALQTPPAAQIPESMIGHFIPGTGLNPRGRYPVHLHRAGINETDGTDPNNPILKPGSPAQVENSVVVDSPGWGYVSHTSHVNFDNNIAFNVIGASFVTEAGNEMGRFVGNLAIKGIGANTSEGIESRKLKQDFGFQGDGFWFQGPAIQVENNIAVSQRHDGFVYFTVPLVQNYKWADPASTDHEHPKILSARQGARMTTTMLAAAYDAALIAALGGPGKSVDPGKIPLLSFKNNTALANGVGFESWFHLLGVNLPRELGSQIVGLNVANTRGTAMFDPYTNLTTVKDTLLVGNPSSPNGTGMNRNDVTANFTYDNVTIRGFSLGIAIPVNGLNIVSGGTFQNKRNFEITTANSQTRTVLLNDKLAADNVTVASPLVFLPLPKATDEAARINVDLRTNYSPKERDLSKLFNPDIIRMGTVWLNSFALGINPATGPKQLYYYQQAGDFKPFPTNDETGAPISYGTPVKDAFGNIVDYSGIEVPKELLDKSNTELFKTFGLAIGGTVAPAGAVNGMKGYAVAGSDPTVLVSPRINGLIGGLSSYHASLDATSSRYTKNVDPTGQNPQYVFGYKFAKTNPNGESTSVNVTVKVGNFVPASGYPVQLTTLLVNGTAVTIPQPLNAPAKPTPPIPTPLIVVPAGGTLTSAQKTANYNTTKANTAATNKYNSDLKAFNTYWTNYYNTPVKLSLREGWNTVTGDLDGTGNMRTQLIYGDTIPPDLNLTSPDRFQLRRLSTAANPWTPGVWDASSQSMTGVALGSNDFTPKTATVTGQFVAVMNPNDLSFGFGLKGKVVDNSFGDKSFEVFIGNLKNYLDPAGLPLLTPVTTTPTDPSGASSSSAYQNILNYQSLKDPTQPPVAVVQHLQTIFFGVKDIAGNSKTFALTIYLDPTAPRVGGSANPSGSTTPSASMVALANQAYVIDLETFVMISLTDPKKK